MILKREENGPVWREILNDGIAILEAAGVPDADHDAFELLSAAFGVSRTHFYLDADRPVRSELLAKCGSTYRENLKKRAERIPLQQILGSTWFMGLEFAVNEHVLCPRPDTETLVEAVLADVPDPDAGILDLCTGSGCIAISLAYHGKYRKVEAVDISRDALNIARTNAKKILSVQKGILTSRVRNIAADPLEMHLTGLFSKNGGKANPSAGGATEEREFILREGDLFGAVPDGEKYRVIVSNPPYIPTADCETLMPEVRDHEPRIALDGDADGLRFYRILAEKAAGCLERGGRVYYEIGYDQAESVSGLLEKAGYSDIRVLKDLGGLDRVVTAEYS